jgi:hypothetical protein
MDQKLRELERQAQNDPQASMQLAAALKRLVQDQWQAVPCDNFAVSGHHMHCRECGGQGFLRINVTQLNEYIPLQNRSREALPTKSATAWGDPGYGALPNDLANHYDDQ